MSKIKVKDLHKPLRRAKGRYIFRVTQEVLDEARSLDLTGRQMMALAIVRPTAPNAPVVVLGKSGSARINNGKIEIGA
jgi:hypothetical protein